jgi:hypothetical protein
MHLEKTLKNGNHRGNPLNAPRCGAKTRKGTPCKGPAVRGKKRCRMHGGTNPGRPRDPSVQRLKYYKMVRTHVTKICADCILINLDCSKIHGGDNIPENFERRINKYCRASIQMRSTFS